jgi:hypothetical protein
LRGPFFKKICSSLAFSSRKNGDNLKSVAGLQIKGVFVYFTHLRCQKRIGDDVRDFKYVFSKKKKGSPSNDKPCHYAGKSPKMNTHTLVLLIKIYSTDISVQKDGNTLSICLIGFTYSPIHQSRHIFGIF